MPEMNNMKVGNDVYEVADLKSRGVSLTWAQYQALSYEEQHNGTAYYITDMNAIYPVDHELNANSRNAVANDIVTPHILAMENVLGAKNQFALAYNLGTTGLSTANDELKNTLTDTASTFVLHFRGIKNDDTQDFLFGDVITSAGNYEYAVYITSSYKSLFFKHNGVVQDLGIYIPAVTPGRWVLSFNVVGYNPSVVGGLEITEIMLRPAGTDPTYVPYAMTNSELTERIKYKKYIYSQTEHPVGQWINGDTIYEKTVEIVNLTIPLDGVATINIDDYFANVSKCISYELIDTNGNVLPTAMLSSPLYPYNIGVGFDTPNNHITFTRGTGGSVTLSMYLTLRYIRTTV